MHFNAAAQYDDWRGECATDNADGKGIRDFMLEKGLIAKEETVVGLQFYAGTTKFVSINALVIDATDFDSAAQALATTPDPLPVRRIHVELSILEFVDMFKRFSIALSPRGLDLVGRELNVTNA